MKKINILLILIVLVAAVSCKKTYTPGNTVAVKAANGWWVTFTQGGVDVYSLGHFFLSTYNTSAGDDSLWIDDLGNSWNFKCKAKIDYNTLLFSTTNAQNEYYNITVNIANGKILPKGGHSRSGNITDSIYFESNFSDDPTNTYVISGTARTGFIEDDY